MLHQRYHSLFYTEQEMLKKQKSEKIFGYSLAQRSMKSAIQSEANGIFELSIRPISHNLSIHKKFADILVNSS